MDPHTAQKTPAVEIVAPRFVEIELFFEEEKPFEIPGIKVLRDPEAGPQAVTRSSARNRAVGSETQNIETAIKMSARSLDKRSVRA